MSWLAEHNRRMLEERAAVPRPDDLDGAYNHGYETGFAGKPDRNPYDREDTDAYHMWLDGYSDGEKDSKGQYDH